MSCKRSKVILDHGWAWVVLCSAFVGMALTLGVVLSLTVFLEDFKQEYDVGSRKAGTITGICLAFMTLMSPAASYVCEKIGFRAIFMVSGVLITLSLILSSVTTTYIQMLCTMMLSGIGFSFAYTASSVIMGFYFQKRYVLVNGIVFAGTYAGIFTLPTLFEYLRSLYTWRQCYILIAAICLHICVAGSLIPPPPPRRPKSMKTLREQSMTDAAKSDSYNKVKDETDDNDPKHSSINLEENFSANNEKNVQPKFHIKNDNNICWTLRITSSVKRVSTALQLQLFIKLDFLIFFTVLYVYSVGYMGTIVHFAARSEWTGLTTAQAGFLLSLMGIGGMFSRFTHGFLVDKKYIRASHLFFISLVLSGILVLLLTFTSSHILSQIMSFLFGITSGVLSPLGPVIVKDLVGIQRLNSAVGLTLVAYGLADFSGSILTGWIYDITNNYNKSFYMTSTCFMSAALLLVIVMIIERKNVNSSLEHYADVKEKT